MRQQLRYRDVFPLRRRVRNVLADVILQRQLSCLHELQRGSGLDVLRDGVDVENSVDGDRNVVFEIRAPVPARECRLSPSCDGNGHAGDWLLERVGGDCVDRGAEVFSSPQR